MRKILWLLIEQMKMYFLVQKMASNLLFMHALFALLFASNLFV